jgi:hypothetical protein
MVLLSLCSRVAIGLRPNTKLSRLSGTRTCKSIVDDFDMKLGTVRARVSLSYGFILETRIPLNYVSLCDCLEPIIDDFIRPECRKRQSNFYIAIR